MGRYRNYSSSGNNGLLMRLLGYALTTFIIPFVILLMRILAYALITFVIPFVINMIKNKLSNQQRLLCNKCHGKLEVIDKGNFYCKNCKIIKFDRY
jgi:cobalamin biosynthesis protein CobD/CbiB